MGVALFLVQIGVMPPSTKPLKGFGPGVVEIVEDHDGDAYRAIYTLRIRGNVHVLHVFQKKSTTGVKTPKRHLDLIAQRLKELLAR